MSNSNHPDTVHSTNWPGRCDDLKGGFTSDDLILDTKVNPIIPPIPPQLRQGITSLVRRTSPYYIWFKLRMTRKTHVTSGWILRRRWIRTSRRLVGWSLCSWWSGCRCDLGLHTLWFPPPRAGRQSPHTLKAKYVAVSTYHMGYSFRLIAKVLLYALFPRQDNTYRDPCYTNRWTLAGTRNS